MRASVNRKKTRYVLTIPRWELLVVVARDLLSRARAFGPSFSSQVKSTIWLATSCPSVRVSFGNARCMIAGKKPSMLEKWWRVCFGAGLYCLLARCASSNAKIKPSAVTARAASFRSGGIVMTGVFRGIML